MISNIRSHWQPWVRISWALAALTSLWAFAGILVLTRQFVDAPSERIAAGLQALQWSRDAYFWFTVATTTPLFVGFFILGAIIFWQRPNDWMAVFSSIFLISFAASNSLSPSTEFLAVLAAAPPAFRLPYFVTGIMSFGTVAVFLALFPDGHFVPKWMRWIALVGFLHALAWGLFPDVYGDPSGPFSIIQLGVSVIIFGGSMVAQIWRYRNYATPTQKQQTKWFLYGLGLSIGLQLMLSAIPAILPPGNAQTSVSFDLFISTTNLSFLFIPLSLAVAILRFRLWDIDIIIRRTLSYAVLTALLALIYFGGVVLVQSVFRGLLGTPDSPLITVIATLTIAALFTPLRRGVQNFIDRRFYRRKYDAEQTLANFATLARDEVDTERLARALLGVVEETMQPASVSLLLTTTTVEYSGNQRSAVSRE